MPIDLIQFGGESYPAFQAAGNAAQFALPFACQFCRGDGVDVGCGRPEWAFPGAVLIDPALTPWHATQFPPDLGPLDYVFSSHTLEHLPDWVDALDYWADALKPSGVLFLYLPDYSQRYWRPWNNRKHRTVLTPTILRDYLTDRGFVRILAAGPDLNSSFVVVAAKGNTAPPARAATFAAFLERIPPNGVILETGCQRQEQDAGDGASTTRLGRRLATIGGRLVSLDNDAGHCALARRLTAGLPVEVVETDSVAWLTGYGGSQFDAIYLDSHDANLSGHAEHCLAEVTAALPHLTPAAPILIDDSWRTADEWHGKGRLAIPHLLALGWRVVLTNYQTLLARS